MSWHHVRDQGALVVESDCAEIIVEPGNEAGYPVAITPGNGRGVWWRYELSSDEAAAIAEHIGALLPAQPSRGRHARRVS